MEHKPTTDASKKALWDLKLFRIDRFSLSFTLRTNLLKCDLGWCGFLVERAKWCDNCKVYHKPSEEFFGPPPGTMPSFPGEMPEELKNLMGASPDELLAMMRDSTERLAKHLADAEAEEDSGAASPKVH